MGYIFAPVSVQAFVTQAAIKAFYEAALQRLESISPGIPWSTIALFRKGITCCPPMQVSTSGARHFLVTLSISVNTRKRFPVQVESLTKSMDQRSFGLRRRLLSGMPLFS